MNVHFDVIEKIPSDLKSQDASFSPPCPFCLLDSLKWIYPCQTAVNHGSRHSGWNGRGEWLYSLSELSAVRLKDIEKTVINTWRWQNSDTRDCVKSLEYNPNSQTGIDFYIGQTTWNTETHDWCWRPVFLKSVNPQFFYLYTVLYTSSLTKLPSTGCFIQVTTSLWKMSYMCL